MHFFISYAKADTRDLASQIDRELQKLDGITSWMDRDLQYGSDWSVQIQRQIDRCDQMIVLISPDVNRLADDNQDISFVIKEIHYAQQQRKPILPILAQKTKMPVIISGSQHIDLTQNRDMGIREVLKEINRKIEKAGQLPISDIEEPIYPSETVPNPSLAKSDERKILTLPLIIVMAQLIGLFVIALIFNSNENGASSLIISTIEATATSTNTATLTPSDTPSPTKTPTPTITNTPNVDEVASTLIALETIDQRNENHTATATKRTQEAIVKQTQDAIDTATATLWTDTPTPNFTASIQARITEWALGTESAQLTATATLWTQTPTPTFTPSNTPTPTPDPIEQAKFPVARNREWTPYEQEFDGVTMVLVPVGEFNMGTSESDIERAFDECVGFAASSEDCQKEWYLDESRNGENTQVFDTPFWIDKYEVTNELFGSSDCTQRSSEPDQPRICVSWFEAKEFCESRDARLPTEAEWEYVARGPDNNKYPWGRFFDRDRLVWNGIEAGTAPVGSRPEGASWVGAFDMSGNTLEWTSSIYNDYPYIADDERGERDALRVLRGGSWVTANLTFLRSAHRESGFPFDRFFNYGFRCARDFEPAD